MASESVTLSVGTPLCPYGIAYHGIAYRRSYGLSFRWTVPFSLGSDEPGFCSESILGRIQLCAGRARGREETCLTSNPLKKANGNRHWIPFFGLYRDATSRAQLDLTSSDFDQFGI
jgi:hypothetical protein